MGPAREKPSQTEKAKFTPVKDAAWRLTDARSVWAATFVNGAIRYFDKATDSWEDAAGKPNNELPATLLVGASPFVWLLVYLDMLVTPCADAGPS